MLKRDIEKISYLVHRYERKKSHPRAFLVQNCAELEKVRACDYTLVQGLHLIFLEFRDCFTCETLFQGPFA